MKTTTTGPRLSFAAIALSALVLAACSSSSPSASDTRFDSAHSIALDGTIPAGTIIATSDDDVLIKEEIRAQLMYTVGLLNSRLGVADMSRLAVTVNEKAPLDDGTFAVKYAAKLLVSWPREYQILASVPLVVPARGDYASRNRFYNAYLNDQNGAKRCLDDSAHEVTVGIAWYYYRPGKATCPLRSPAQDDRELVARFNLDLARSAENTSGKAPEYDKVWEDRKLVVTAVFGKEQFGATNDDDPGIAAYRTLYYNLFSFLGYPSTTNLRGNQYPNAANDFVALKWNFSNATIDVQIFLVDEIKSVDEQFRSRYNARTAVSDFVSYSGHSGLGANIRALATMGRFAPNHYQIYLVNGCDTFAYVDNALRDAHQLVNPDFGPDKYFDIITNAMPSYFHMNAASNMAVIQGLLSRSWTYRQILAGFDQSQRAAVTGEQDNNWPLPFNG
jgi:hypothetical protein